MIGPTYQEKRQIFERNFLLGKLSRSEIDALLTLFAGRALSRRRGNLRQGLARQQHDDRVARQRQDQLDFADGQGNRPEHHQSPARSSARSRCSTAASAAATPSAMTDCELLVLNRRDFMPFLENRADICLMLIKILCQRLRQTSEQVEDLQFRHLEARIAKALLHLAEHSGQPDRSTQLGAELHISQSELGHIVGSSRESVNKQLQAWHKAGLIELAKGSIVIRDAAAIEAADLSRTPPHRLSTGAASRRFPPGAGVPYRGDCRRRLPVSRCRSPRRRPRAGSGRPPAGLYCEPGDFHIDPLQPVPRAVITHGHGDHARPGNGQVLATAETIAIMQARYGEAAGGALQPLAYGESLAIGEVAVRLVPAGHVLGSAQIVLDYRGSRVVVSGDYKRRPDPTCAPFEPQHCDLFITEATFGLPVFRHPPDRQEIDKLLHSLALFPERCHLVGVYALGKCQRVLALLRRAGYEEPVYLHGALIGSDRALRELRRGAGAGVAGDRGGARGAQGPHRAGAARGASPTSGRGGCPIRWWRWPRAGCGCASAPRRAASSCRW